jgi:hypothetical protein
MLKAVIVDANAISRTVLTDGSYNVSVRPVHLPSAVRAV